MSRVLGGALEVSSSERSHNSSQKYKLVAACMIGNLLEWYDFAIYGYL
jgi:hypothetical protein